MEKRVRKSGEKKEALEFMSRIKMSLTGGKTSPVIKGEEVQESEQKNERKGSADYQKNEQYLYKTKQGHLVWDRTAKRIYYGEVEFTEAEVLDLAKGGPLTEVEHRLILEMKAKPRRVEKSKQDLLLDVLEN